MGASTFFWFIPGAQAQLFTDVTFEVELDDFLTQGLRAKLNEQDDMVLDKK